MLRDLFKVGMICLLALLGHEAAPRLATAGPLRVGSAMVDISPVKFPVIVNGGFLQARSSTLHDKLHARAIVIDDGFMRIAIVVVDTCMMPRDLIDRAKELAHAQTGIPTSRMLISATHTHSASSAMGALGTPADEEYIKTLPPKIAECITTAVANLTPAQIGWTVIQDYEHTHNRRWIYRSDKMLTDPFGVKSVRANMHPGYQNPDTLGPSGPVDPGLSVVAFQTLDGQPLALLANYSMHYFGAPAVSADYFGLFAKALAARIQPNAKSPGFVAIMSQGTSGDQHWMDYSRPKQNIILEQYADALASRVHDAYKTITYSTKPTLGMAEETISLRRRTPDAARLEWAKGVVAKMTSPDPKTLPEVYAKEAIHLHENPVRELKLQAIRLGDLGIAAIPDEVFAITGLKIKAMSPLQTTFTIELANGSEGYIPPPEQHRLGGYTTWPARTAALEPEAETKITEALLSLFESIIDHPRKQFRLPETPYATAILDSNPRAFWRLGDIAGTRAIDSSKHNVNAELEGGYAFYLDGPDTQPNPATPPANRSIHFAGGSLKSTPLPLNDRYSLCLWFWNGMPDGVRENNGQIVSLIGAEPSQILSVTVENPGKTTARLQLSLHEAIGKTPIAPKTWHHLALTREQNKTTLFLDGQPEITLNTTNPPAANVTFRFAAGSSAQPAYEGKLAEIAVHDRVLDPGEIARLSRTSPRSP